MEQKEHLKYDSSLLLKIKFIFFCLYLRLNKLIGRCWIFSYCKTNSCFFCSCVCPFSVLSLTIALELPNSLVFNIRYALYAYFTLLKSNFAWNNENKLLNWRWDPLFRFLTVCVCAHRFPIASVCHPLFYLPLAHIHFGYFFSNSYCAE